MDVQLQELIDKIKKDGISSAEKDAKKIISDAEKQAADIVKNAEEKANQIIDSAKKETERMEKASEDAITQSGRNLLLSFHDCIVKSLSVIVKKETEKAYDKDLLKKLIPETVKSWIANTDASDVSVLLPAKELKELESSVKTSLKSQIAKGLELKTDATLTSGFRIGSKDGQAFYDFSAEEIANLFSAYLNPKISKLMKDAALSLDIQKSDSTVKSTPEDTKKDKKTAAKKAPVKKAAVKKTTAKGKK